MVTKKIKIGDLLSKTKLDQFRQSKLFKIELNRKNLFMIKRSLSIVGVGLITFNTAHYCV